LSSAGACGFWFGGSWGDIMTVSGVPALVVASIGRASSILSRQERIVFEIVTSFLVGLISGMFQEVTTDRLRDLFGQASWPSIFTSSYHL
jgi:hypothetical protein